MTNGTETKPAYDDLLLASWAKADDASFDVAAYLALPHEVRGRLLEGQPPGGEAVANAINNYFVEQGNGRDPARRFMPSFSEVPNRAYGVYPPALVWGNLNHYAQKSQKLVLNKTNYGASIDAFMDYWNLTPEAMSGGYIHTNVLWALVTPLLLATTEDEGVLERMVTRVYITNFPELGAELAEPRERLKEVSTSILNDPKVVQLLNR